MLVKPIVSKYYLLTEVSRLLPFQILKFSISLNRNSTVLNLKNKNNRKEQTL